MNTTLCYIEQDGKILLLYRNRKKNDLNGGKWIGVGGKFEPGETADECVKREVFEETGLTLTEYRLRGLVKFVSEAWGDEDMYLYHATGFTGELNTDCKEGELHWVEKEKVLDLPTWEGDRYFLGPLLRGEEPVDMMVRYEGFGDAEHLAEVKDLRSELILEQAKGFRAPHAFSTRTGGVSDGIYESLNLGMNRGDEPARVTENWRRFLEAAGVSRREFVCGKQVHGNHVHIATAEDLRPAYGPGELIEADGYVTKEKNVPLSIFTADCVPLLLEDAEHDVIGAIHCGWRSTVADIEGEAIRKMGSLGAQPECIRAAIGPAIDRCCFEVGREVIDAVEELLGEDCSPLYDAKANGKYMLDLRGVVARRLVQLGLAEERIERVGGCTMCHPERYYSHRYTNGERGSLACVIEQK